MTDEFDRVRLEDMISHDEVLERYTWMSAQILNRWRRSGAIRFFRGAHGKIWYPQKDLDAALNADLRLGES